MLANELADISEIDAFTTSSFLPGQGDWGRQEFASLEGGRAGSAVLVNDIEVNASFLQSMQTGLLIGEDFNDDGANAANPVILNQAAAEFYQWSGTPIGKVLRTRDGTDYTIIGVMEDARFDGVQNTVEPLNMHYTRDASWVLIARMRQGNMAAGLVSLKAAWEKVYPAYPFEYKLLSASIEGLLGEEVEFASRLFQSTFVAIFIACLGLYGHATFTAHQNAREVGIRKVFGASALDIFKLLAKEYGLLILVANVIAWPMALYLVNLWLAEFTERIDPNIWYFLQAALIIVSLAALSVAVKMRQVMRANPINVLHYE